MRGPDIALYSVGDQCRGKGNKKEIAAVVQQVRKMTPGSRALTDFRDSMKWGRGDIYCGNHGWARGEKVAMVVRVVPDPHKDISLNIVPRFITARTSSSPPLSR